MRRYRYMIPTVGLALVILLLVTACTPASPFRASEVEGPKIEIIAPANFSTTSRGSTTNVRAFIDDPKGIRTIELRVDGQAVETKIQANPPVTQLTQELFWTPQAVGSYQLSVAAQNQADEWKQSEPITITVVDVLAGGTAIRASTPTAAAASSSTSVTATPSCTTCATPVPCCSPCITPVPHPLPCYDNAAYVADVTVPDGTQFDKGAAFDKTWRLRNTGTCTWTTGYQLVFVGGSQLGAPSAVAVPHEVPPDATVDITVRMVAPNAVGTYRSNWQMRNPDCGNLFGSIVYALIQVRPGPGDLPVINRFEVVPGVINQGQQATLYWEYVNGTSARLFPGDQAVGPTGSQIVSPNATTSYRLTVSNAAGTVERAVTLIVQPGPIPQPPPASPANLTISAVRRDGFDFTWTDTSTDEQGFRLYNADIRQVVATFGPNANSGAIGGLACGTSYSFFLVAFNERGESWPSNTVQATTSACGG
jgi:hypothetical protein